MSRPWEGANNELMQAEIHDARVRLRKDGRRGVTMEALGEEVFGPRGIGRSKSKR